MSITFKTTRKAARLAGDLFYFTGRPCGNGHVEKRYARGAMCYGCLKMHRDRNKARNVARAKAHQVQNPRSAARRALRWRAKNPHKANAIEAGCTFRGICESLLRSKTCKKVINSTRGARHEHHV